MSAASALLERANDPPAADTIAFARLIGARLDAGELLLLGLSRAEVDALISRHFPHGQTRVDTPSAMLWSPHWPFVSELRALLLKYDVTAMKRAADAYCLATIIATACLRPDHLWRDLGLSGRDDVTAILQRHYPDLIVRNVKNLRWKKFLAQEVALAHGRPVTHAPGCPGCEDFAHCYPSDSTRP
ncbi:hydrogenase [Caballeronia terrestris]|uniref:Hydrogenase n=1 Tax=Caballeronia terrestris TaxID=1226301 RepID=A0A158F208_9BURK|nr:nitrogen fixation protein NifQ [Caballeronia terrestris]SAL13781.1 hydrogenase [Caballeronia terrestris]